MTRAATFQDIPVVEVMICEMYAASKYRGRVEISNKAMRELLMGAVAAQGQNGPQASMLQIADDRGRAVGFMLGTLSRIYGIGDKLVANDLFLYVRPRSRAVHTFALIDAYIAWARANRKVLEIALSWNDALPGAARVADLYLRKGFAKNGELFELRLDGGGVQ